MADGVWSGSEPGRQHPGTDALRIGDAEREQATEELRAHTLDGRLTMDEYTERLEAVYAARTRGDLRPIMADLPALGGPGPAPAAGQAGPFLGPVGPGPAQPGPAQPGPPGHQHPHRAPYGRSGFGGSAWSIWLIVAIVLTVASHGLAWPVWVVGPLILCRGGRRGGFRRDPSTNRR